MNKNITELFCFVDNYCKIMEVLNKLCQTAFLVQLNFQSAGKKDIKLRHS